MTNTIGFLESLGASPADAAVGGSGYAVAIAALDVDEAQRLALLDRDGDRLSMLLRGSAPMFCVIATPDEEGEPDTSPDEDGDEEPSDDPEDGAAPSGR